MHLPPLVGLLLKVNQHRLHFHFQRVQVRPVQNQLAPQKVPAHPEVSRLVLLRVPAHQDQVVNANHQAKVDLKALAHQKAFPKVRVLQLAHLNLKAQVRAHPLQIRRLEAPAHPGQLRHRRALALLHLHLYRFKD